MNAFDPFGGTAPLRPQAPSTTTQNQSVTDAFGSVGAGPPSTPMGFSNNTNNPFLAMNNGGRPQSQTMSVTDAFGSQPFNNMSGMGRPGSVSAGPRGGPNPFQQNGYNAQPPMYPSGGAVGYNAAGNGNRGVNMGNNGMQPAGVKPLGGGPALDAFDPFSSASFDPFAAPTSAGAESMKRKSTTSSTSAAAFDPFA